MYNAILWLFASGAAFGCAANPRLNLTPECIAAGVITFGAAIRGLRVYAKLLCVTFTGENIVRAYSAESNCFPFDTVCKPIRAINAGVPIISVR